MDLYKLLGTLLENDGKSGRFRLMKQPECVVIAKEMRRIAENLLFFEENLVNEVDLTDEEADILKRASEQKEEKNGASEAKKGRFSDLVKKQEERQESSKGSGSSGGRGRGKGRGSGLGGRGRGVGRGSGRGVGRVFDSVFWSNTISFSCDEDMKSSCSSSKI
ncbi:hypothetical protein KUTeg_012642 [Tegillarca granosa]|uniref:Uncharacterized protein n=1 Tax=Tegillarca granosa TaxID=220873 RepID=A0ABQ9F062_TEGGR|nr:hypothetical protein KUTeg_012642 [Tegillarca granosa]